MFDPVKAIRTMLLADLDVASLAGENVFGEILPERFVPTDNPAIVITSRGGSSHGEIPMQSCSVQVACWAGVNQFVLARQVYGAVYLALFSQQNIDLGSDGKLVTATADNAPSSVVDPDLGWATVVGHFTVVMAASDTVPGPAVLDEEGFAIEFGGSL
jgi:hypothetical protein